MTPEHDRISSDHASWRRWGPYLAERAWATVREDYSANGDAWGYFPHDHARSRAYRWNEDGLAGISDEKGQLCFAIALWNGRDPFLKERLFGLSGPEGNHGEDVKERYFYLDATPSHCWLQMLYQYPQAEFPYARLLQENARRGKDDGEYELADTGVFDGDRYFDVFVEYAKADADDILIRLRVVNRGPEPATLHMLPTLWFRNTWSWEARGSDQEPSNHGDGSGGGKAHQRPHLWADGDAVVAEHPALGRYTLVAEGSPELVFTENDTNIERLYGATNPSPYVKDAFHRYVVNGERDAVNPERTGTKAAFCYRLDVGAGEEVSVRLRLTRIENAELRIEKERSLHEPTERAETGIEKGSDRNDSAANFSILNSQFSIRQAEADAFYAALLPNAPDEQRRVFRQALAGMIWCKQFYHYRLREWLQGDPGQPPPPRERLRGRNWQWQHLYNERVMSMPDAWEYPWYAAWDLAFHCIPLAIVDPHFAKGQLDLLGREWYQHPNGQLPAYEWNFADVNPPVHAWACYRVYKIEQKHWGRTDRAFLERNFHKLLLTFTWWVNRKDTEGNNVFGGGFLGLDNIGVFDRSAELPTGGHLEQSDGTSWMGMFCLDMLTIALELAREDNVYESIATKFFEHFLAIADALNNLGGDGIALWDEEDEFFYDVLHMPEGQSIPLKLRSFVGLIPLFAVRTIEPDVLEKLPEFRHMLEWYLENRPDQARLVSRWQEEGAGERRLLALCRGHRMKCLLRRALDPAQFLSDYGVRSLSKEHGAHPYVLNTEREEYTVRYEPAESRSGVFGGNSNWRGPVWFPLNYLLIEALQRYHHYYGDDFKVECPTGSGQFLTLREIADELSRRLVALFLPDAQGKRPTNGPAAVPPDYVLFYEYFHGDTGAGLGASHQTGWTGLVAKLIHQQSGGAES